MGLFFSKYIKVTPLFLVGIAPVQCAWGEVEFDGTVGPTGRLSGDMVIPETQGTMVGNNLFHSFSTFNINTGESVLFTGQNTTSNIISRVTGASASTINGSLDHNMPNASFWLLNPNGILFGENASLPTMGAFNATTADYLLFEEGSRFGADTSLPENSVLSVANPSAFGFIGSVNGSITVHNSELITTEGAGLSLVGGDIEISGGTLVADRGEITLASVGSAGEAGMSATGINIDTLSQGGLISIQASEIGENYETLGELATGSISIRGGELVVENNSRINAHTYEDTSGVVDIDVKQDITLSGSKINPFSHGIGDSPHVKLSAGGDILLQNKSTVVTSCGSISNSVCDSGDVNITAQNLTLSSESKIATTVHSPGKAGDINVNITDTLAIEDSTDNRGMLSTTSNDLGSTGNIDITARAVNLDHGYLLISRHNENFEAAGDIRIHADSLTMTNNSLIATGTREEGGAIGLWIRDGIFMTESRIKKSSGSGDLLIDTSELMMEDGSTLITTPMVSGSNGSLQVFADRVMLTNSKIFIWKDREMAQEQSRDISIIANEHIELNHLPGRPGEEEATSISTINSGNSGGNITLSTPDLVIRGNSVIFCRAEGTGKSGDINIDVNRLRLNESGAIGTRGKIIDSIGSININAQDSVFVGTDSEIATFSKESADAGDIRISASIVDIDGGRLGTSSLGSGAGGALILENLEQLSLKNGGTIESDALDIGKGGRVDIDADSIHISGDVAHDGRPSGIQSNSEGRGHAGTISIGSTQSPIGSLTLVNGGYISTSTTGLGNAGEININAAGAVTLQANTQEPYITSSAQGDDPDALGSAGAITLNASELNIRGSGNITTDTQSNQGAPANIKITVNDLLIEGVGATTLQAITALENGQQPQVPVTGITSNATSHQRGGSITVNVSDHARLYSGIISASSSGAGGGGDIYIGNGASPVGLLSLDENSALFARAQQGNGGNIFIYPDAFLRDRNSSISADSTQGNAGLVEIDHVDQDVTNTILDLDNPLIGPELLINQACDPGQIRKHSSLTVDGQGGLRWSPGDYIPSKMSRISTDDGNASDKAGLDSKTLSVPAVDKPLRSVVDSNWDCHGGTLSN